MCLSKYFVSAAVFFAATAFVSILWTSSASADKRVALVIGNSSYQTVPKLPNPAGDASAVGQMFKDAGFDLVDVQIDVSNLDFKRALRRFADAAIDSDIAIVFFAGHGIELRGINYMIPIDAKLADERDAPDEALSLDRIIEAIDGAKRLRLVIVDACRDNPFGVTMRRQTALRTASRGLTRVEPQSTETLIAFAAKAGSTAEDGHGKHSPLTTALLNHLTLPGLDIRLAFGHVRDEVMKITHNRQEPFVYGSLGGDFISLVPQPSQSTAPDPTAVKADYELVEKVGTKKAWEVFVSTYPTGFYAELAKAQLAKLNAAEQTANKVATLEPPASPSPVGPTSDEARAWDRVKDLSDQAALQAFIKRYPNSPLALTAQRRLEALQQIVKEEEEKTRLERETAQRRAEEERRAKAAEAERAEQERWARAAEAERQRVAQLIAQQQAEAERRAQAEAERQKAAQQAAEEERKAKTAEAERQKAAQVAAQRAAEEERKAKAAEAERQKAAQVAAQQATEEERKAKAAEAERQKAAQVAAQHAAEEERKATAAEAERQKAAQAAEQKAAEEERKAKAATEPERQKAAQLAAQQAADEERKAKAAEAEGQKAAQQTAEEERKANAAAEAERQKAAQLAAQRESERQKAAQLAAQRESERQKAAQLAAQQAAEEERNAKAAEAARQKAALLAAQQAAEEERKAQAAEAERQKAARLALQQAAEEERRTKAAEAERQKAAQLAAQQAAEEERKAKAAEAERQKAAVAAQQVAEDERRAKLAEAERVSAAQQVGTGSDKISMLETSPSEKSSTASELIHSAQIELTRLGCFSGDPDGTLNAATQAGINHYLSRRGRRDSQIAITDSFVSELRSQQARVCPLDCPPGQIVDGNICVAERKGSKPAKAAQQEEEIQHKHTSGRARAKQEAAQPRPHVHQEVSATPRQFHSGGGGGGGGGGGTTIGVGF